MLLLCVQIVLDHCVERTSRDDNEPSLTVHTAALWLPSVCLSASKQWLKWKIGCDRTHFLRGPLNFSVAPSHEGRTHQMLMRVNIRCHSGLQQATVVNA